MCKNHPLYQLWYYIRVRCTDPYAPNYHKYGGRGITMCDRWRDDFMAFVEDMGPRPSKNHSVDRIDNTKGYGPDNCRWATPVQQANNKSNTATYVYQGDTYTASEICDTFNINRSTLKNRVGRLGMTIEEAIERPVLHHSRRYAQYTFRGKTQGLKMWAKELGIKFQTLWARIHDRHMTVEEAFTRPMRAKCNRTGRNQRYLYQFKMLTLPEISRRTGIPHATLHNRVVKQGMAVNDAIRAIRANKK